MKKTTLAAATGLALVALSPVSAQNAGTATTDPIMMPVEDDDDDDSGKWGLLGLLGLAGLLGLRRRDNHDHRDNRTGANNRP